MAALALLLSTGALSIAEAAQSDDARDNFCRRDGYCYTQKSQDDRGEYCRNGQRGCW